MRSPTSSRASCATSPAATPAPSSLPPVRRTLVLALAAALLWPSIARAQTTDARNRAVIILDASKSMNEDAGNGGSRLDAAKQAVGTLLDRLPPGVPLGLRG